MNFKKTLCTLIAVMTVLCGFTACSGDTATEEESQSTVSSAEEAESADVGEVADKLKSDIAFEDELVEFDSTKIEKIFGISEDKYTSAKVYVSSSGATPEEIACFEAVDSASAEEIKSALETRIEAQRNTFTDYKPEQAPKLDSPVLEVNGNCVYMCISGDNTTAENVIG